MSDATDSRVIGGLGYLAVQFLRKMGHRLSAFSHSPAKKAMIERLGADLGRFSTLVDFCCVMRPAQPGLLIC